MNYVSGMVNEVNNALVTCFINRFEGTKLMGNFG